MSDTSAKPDIKDLVKINQIGWFAIQHKDGWWAGTKEGVTCYKERYLARVALTLIHARSGERLLKYKIEIFPKNDLKEAGDFTPKYSAEEALKLLEGPKRIKKF